MVRKNFTKASRNGRRSTTTSRKSANSKWAVAPVTVYSSVINHSFPESGASVTYTSYDVIKDDTNISRPASISLQYASSKPTTFIVEAGTSFDLSNVVPISWIWKQKTSVLLASTTVRTLKLKYPKNQDYDNTAGFRVTSSGPMTISGFCTFTAKNSLEDTVSLLAA